MDGKQFLKEAKEAYSEHIAVNFSNFTVEEFKRSIYHYIGRDGTAINFLCALLHQKTREDRKKYPGLMLHPERQADVDIVLKRAKEETDHWKAEHQRWFELLVEVVLKYIDEIAIALKQKADDRAALQKLFTELGKLPSLIGDERLGPMVDTIIRKYMDAASARHDLNVFKEMMKLTSDLRGKKDSITSLLSDTIKDASSHVSEIIRGYTGIEDQVLAILSECLEGKYVFWNDGATDDWKKIMRIDKVTLDRGGRSELLLHGPYVAPLRWDHKDKCEYAQGMYWSYLEDISKHIGEIAIVEWEDLLGYVEKHAPFAMELIQQLGKDYKLQ